MEKFKGGDAYAAKYDLQQLATDLTKIKETEKLRRQPLELKWEQAVNAYNNRVYPSLDESNVTTNQKCLPLVEDAVEELFSQSFRALFPTTDHIMRIDCGTELRIPADIVRDFMQSKIRRFDIPEIRRCLKLGALIGNAFVTLNYDRKVKKVKSFNIKTGKKEEVEKVVFEGIVPKVIHQLDWFFQSNMPFGEGIFAQIYSENILSLRRKADLGLIFNLENLQERMTTESPNQQRQSEQSESDFQNDVNTVAHVTKVSQHEITEYWGDFQVTNNETGEVEVLEGHRVLVADDEVVVGIGPNPYDDACLPGILYRFMLSPDPRAYYGSSVILSGLDLHHAANKIFNVLLDLADKECKNPQTYDDADEAFVKWLSKQGGKVKIGAGELIPSTGNRGLKALSQSQFATNIGFTTVGELVNRFQEATKSIKNFSSKGYEKTATEIAGILEQVSSFMADLVTWQQQFVMQYCEKWWSLFVQYQVAPNPEAAFAAMSKELKYDVKQKMQANGLNPLVLFTDWDFQANGNNYFALRQRRVQQMQTFIAIAAGLPEGLKDLIQSELLKVVAKEMELVGLDNVFKTKEQKDADAQKEQEQQAMMMQQQKDMLQMEIDAKLQKDNPGQFALMQALKGGNNGTAQPMAPGGAQGFGGEQSMGGGAETAPSPENAPQ